MNPIQTRLSGLQSKLLNLRIQLKIALDGVETSEVSRLKVEISAVETVLQHHGLQVD